MTRITGNLRRPIAPKTANEGASAMNQFCDSLTESNPARRFSATALPVLIEIPNIEAATFSPRTRVRRRRLRREVRVAGYILLAIFPLSLAIVSFGSDRFPPIGARSFKGLRPPKSTPSPDPVLDVPTISLAPLEPIVSVERDRTSPVFLPGYLLPADTPEDMSHGGH